ncbi:MAG: AAA family ATPase [Candidatus Aenigmarchaeota archaeon]|nr:AAA family ATPase [Candidatus Aenigmarchaeota archaeon]NIP39958.1 AAA family ATPase [Candidatus Aenigmarchaeota archaeon]NIQ17677.1 AAA family ATPase [Candidatus Aenigmarchaeota archaeon]NIS72865.1 AAA family ATPase [Candidatus Aenigmarchaeota archaeon]
MAQISLNEIFQGYVGRRGVFKNKETLSIAFTPDNIPHREEQIKQLGMILAPVLRKEKPSNVFIYGKTGTGKSLCASHTIKKLSDQTNGKLKTIYINCKMRRVSDTEYRLLSQLISFFGVEVPYTGLPTDSLYKKFFNLLDQGEGNTLLVLDEIDALVKKVGDGILYNLTRINQELKKTKLTIVGISNNISFINDMDPRVRSSLSEEEAVFPPYNASELRDILTERSQLAFNPGTVSSGVIEKCSALAAQEHGDARKALDLLRVAGEVAERMGNEKVLKEHVDLAEKKLDTDKTLEITKTQPRQSQCVLLSILELFRKGTKNTQTGDIYDVYIQICRRNNLKVLTQRRVSDLISELDMFGIVNSKVISKGRYGRTREIKLNLSGEMITRIENFLKEEFI